MPEGGAGDSSADRERLERRVWLDLQRAEKVPTILARRIQREIVERNLQPGDMLGSEAVMLARFGVGRASLREALRILENHGIVRIKPGPGGGPVVNEVTSNDWGRSMTIHLHSARATIRDLLEARMIMEPVVARLAAGRLTPEMEASVRTAAKEGHDALLLSSDEWAASAEEFHAAVASASGNRVVDLFSTSLISIHRARVGSTFPNDEREVTTRIHDRIAEAICAGDADRAEELMRFHITELVAAIEAWMPNQMDELIDWR
jgi:GntR family transcriptional repressor for pyruvate dehydrogenase complex